MIDAEGPQFGLDGVDPTIPVPGELTPTTDFDVLGPAMSGAGVVMEFPDRVSDTPRRDERTPETDEERKAREAAEYEQQVRDSEGEGFIDRRPDDKAA